MPTKRVAFSQKTVIKNSLRRNRQKAKRKNLVFTLAFAVLGFALYLLAVPALKAEVVTRFENKVAKACFQTLYLPVYCEEDPPQPPLKRGENPIKVPLFKGDLGGSPGLKTRPRVSISSPSVSSPSPIDRILAVSDSNENRDNVSELVQQGKDYYESGQFAKAVTAWEQATSSFATQEDELNQAMVLSNLSLAYQHLGQWTQAKEAITKSLEILTKNQFNDIGARSRVLAQALTTQGRLQLTLGQAEQAFTTWQQATTAYRQANDEVGILRSQINQAQALKSLGFYRRALTTLTQVRQTLEKQPDSTIKASGLRSLGSALLLVGDVEQSRRVLQQSLTVAQQLQSAPDICATLFDLGNTARAGQDIKAAMELYQQAAAIATSPLTKIQAQLNQLSLLIEQEHPSTAQTLWTQIQSELGNLPPSRATIYAHIDLGRSLMKLSALHPEFSALNRNAGRLFTTALQQAKSLGDQPAEAHALKNLGRLYEQTQQWSTALSLTQQALILAQSMNIPDITYRCSWQMGRILKAEGDTQGAIAAYAETVKTLQALRSDLIAVSQDVQFSFTETVEPVYRQFVSLLLPSDGSQPSQENLVQARDAIESLQLAELENFFQEACLNAKPELIDRVDPSAAVIYPIILPDHLAVILSLPGQPLRYYQTTLPQNEVENSLDQTLQSLNPAFSSKQRLRLSQNVYDWLIRPAEEHLAASGVKTLVFVLDGSLRNLPMAALHDGKQYLIEKYSIALAPSLQLTDPTPLQRGGIKTLTAGITQPRQGFAALVNVAREVEQIQSELPSVVMLDGAFTSDAFRKSMESSYFPVVHIATHGQFSSKAEETFVLTWDGRINAKQFDAILQPTNPGNKKAIALLVLSACQTAQGDKRATLGLAGVALRAGAQSTLATLWRVNDFATADLMSVFYRDLTNSTITKAEALRHAQLTLLQDPEYKHPFYWAPFVLVGNWL